LEGCGFGLIEAISWYLFGGTEEKPKDLRIAGVPANI
jgi:hypothetical protein